MDNPSLRETLAAAMSGGDAPAAVETSVPVEAAPVTTASDAITGQPVAQTEAEHKAAGTDRPRAADGKFAPKDPAEADAGAPEAQPAAEAKTTEPELATAPEKDPQATEPVRIPASLPAPLKAKFQDLPADVQAAFAKLDEDRTAAKAQWDTKAAQFNRLEEILAPRREKFHLQGLDDARAIQTLFAAQDLLDRSPLEGLAYLARSYGVDLRQLGQAPDNGQAPQAPQFDAALQPLLQQVQTLTQKLEAQEQSGRQAELQRGLSEIEAFKAKPENLYFDDVREDIALLLESGRAKTLQDAYDRAVWASPEIRPLVQNQQTGEKQRADAKAQADAKAKADADARAKAASANRASGSVTGSPALGSSPPPTGSKGSIRADLESAYESLNGV